MNPHGDPELTNVPIPLLEFINVSFVEVETVEVKFGDLFGSELINVELTAIDFIPSARHLNTLADIDFENLNDKNFMIFDATAQKWKNITLQQLKTLLGL